MEDSYPRIHLGASPVDIGENKNDILDLSNDGIEFKNADLEENEAKVDIPPPEIDADLVAGSGEMTISAMLAYVKLNYGSDLHIATGNVPCMRRFGEIEKMKGWRELSEKDALSLIHSTMSEKHRAEFEEEKEVDFSFLDKSGQRCRCNALETLRGPMGVYRLISDKILKFEELGLPESAQRLQFFKKGLILVTGPSGCGKSTTLATLIDMINEFDEGHILTIEDPVEIIHKSKKSLVNHREVDTNTKSFARALKSALREDPDTIMIGEMRDRETISLALTAAETGHLVFGTLHTSSAHKTITRIIDAFPPEEQGQIRTMLAESVQCVISQVLIKRKDGKGRVPAFEIMFGTDAVKNLIRSDKVFQIPSSIEVGARDGMQTLSQSLRKLIAKGTISFEDARRYSKDLDLD